MKDRQPFEKIHLKHKPPMVEVALKEKGSPGQISKRFSIALTQELLDHLQYQMDSYGISLTEAVRRSLARDYYIQEKLKDGAEIYMKQDGQWYMLR
ncbi:MAG: hypothetical protein F6J93_08075 [Oscillatoria sp. SIO1A7]|nr:hypothetical protein [Oscillatoria sp. SIO1A7]